MLADFYPGTTKDFTVTITLNSSSPDITNDTVTIRLKKNQDDPDTDSIIEKDADVTTQGANGIAEFTLTTSETEVSSGNYYYDIEWTRSGGEEYILASDTITVKERVSDV